MVSDDLQQQKMVSCAGPVVQPGHVAARSGGLHDRHRQRGRQCVLGGPPGRRRAPPGRQSWPGRPPRAQGTRSRDADTAGIRFNIPWCSCDRMVRSCRTCCAKLLFPLHALRGALGLEWAGSMTCLQALLIARTGCETAPSCAAVPRSCFRGSGRGVAAGGGAQGCGGGQWGP